MTKLHELKDKEQEMTAETKKTAQDKEQEITAEQAAEVVQKEKLERAERCKMKIQRALDEDKCQIRPYPFINADGKIVAGVEIVAV